MTAEHPTLPPLVHDAPLPSPPTDEVWGSDAIAACLRALDLPFLALNPGASYRGLHDSLVNYLGNADPQMLLCLHEEAAIAIAHGYYKASERMMGAVVHSNVGLLHGSMAIFNAWCDRVPIFLLGATGPWDAARRRPWIDWIHTVSDQGGLIRNFTKWDNQPGSVPAAYEAMLRAAQIARTAPGGPTYINLDVTLQETKIDSIPPLPDVRRFASASPAVPSMEMIDKAAELLSNAANPVILMGRVSRSLEGWQQRIALAEKLQARVLTNFKLPAAFPTDHPLHTAESASILQAADAVLSLDWLDLGGTLASALGPAVPAKVIHISPDAYSHRGWGAEYQALPPTDLYAQCEADAAVPLLLNSVHERPPAAIPPLQQPPAPAVDAITIAGLAVALNEATAGLDICLARLPLGWKSTYRHFRHPLDYLGADGGGGVGSGPGMTVGAALALRDSNRLVVSVIGDGDYLMGVTALWTAAHYRLPLLMIVSNNRSFYNDEQHQARVAAARLRPVENKWIGQRIAGPDIDLAAMARAQGAAGFGPVSGPAELEPVLRQAVQAALGGEVAVVDVRVTPQE